MFEQDVRLIDLPVANIALAEALQFQLSQTQKLPLKRMHNVQLSALKVLLKHCMKNVPFYRDNPLYHEINSWNDFQKLPILAREDIQTYREELICRSGLQGHGNNIEFRSSGSTGTPIHCLSTDRAQVYWRAITLRDHLWHDRDFSKKLAIIKNFPTTEARYPGINASVWSQSTASIFSNGPSIALNSSETIDVQYQWLIENQPDYLLSYPSALHGLAQMHLNANKTLKLKEISTLGESLSAGTRQLVQEAFGCKIKDMYSAQEVGYMALQCPKNDHYHIQSEVCLVEILDEHGNACKPNELGRVVVTPLHNFRMPLIRYAIGDYAIAGDACDCGIQLPTIKSVVGRTRNLVTYPDGRKSWPSYNPMALMDLLPQCQFQIIQVSLNNLEFNVVGEIEITETLKLKVSDIIRSSIGHAFKIDAIKKSEIQRASSGKYEEFVSKL